MDGKEVEITPVGGAMLAFKLDAGSHIIELRYTPEGFKLGLIVSLFGLFIFIAMLVLSRQKINLLTLVGARISKGKANNGEKAAELTEDSCEKYEEQDTLDEPEAEGVGDEISPLADSYDNENE